MALPGCIYNAIHEVSDDIIARHNMAESTAYDVLRMPSWRTLADLKAHRDNLLAFLTQPLCLCPNRTTAVAHLAAAWGAMGTPALKPVYDNAIGPRGFKSSMNAVHSPGYLIPPHTWLRLHSNYIQNYVGPPGDGYLDRVTGCERMRFVVDLPGRFCRKRQNTFWQSFAIAYFGDELQWAHVKASVREYYNAVINNGTHERQECYLDLAEAAITRGGIVPAADPPVGTLPQQLNPDGPPGPGPVPVKHIWDVTPELWQIVADAYTVELVIVSGHKTVGRYGKYPVFTRGSHNDHQVMMLCDYDGAYEALTPLTPDPASWRYVAHMPGNGKTPLAPTQAQMARSDLIRTPYLLLDEHGLPGIPPAGIPAHPMSLRADHAAPWIVPNRILADQSTEPCTAEQEDAMRNTGEWP